MSDSRCLRPDPAFRQGPPSSRTNNQNDTRSFPQVRWLRFMNETLAKPGNKQPCAVGLPVATDPAPTARGGGTGQSGENNKDVARRLLLTGRGCFRSSQEPVLRLAVPLETWSGTAGSAASGALGDSGQFSATVVGAAAAGTAAAGAGLLRGRDAELPGSGGSKRGRQGHSALFANRGGSQVSFGGRGGQRGPDLGPQLWPAASFSRRRQSPRRPSERSGGLCVPQG